MDRQCIILFEILAPPRGPDLAFAPMNWHALRQHGGLDEHIPAMAAKPKAEEQRIFI